MYVIGLIDDEEDQLKKIRRTIKTNAPIANGESYEFKSYLIPARKDDLVNQIYADVMQDIVEHNISSLIVDYKIMDNRTRIKGTDILQKIKDEVPKFPIIVLTEVVEESIEPAFMDADKVYRKMDFFKIEEDYSKEKVRNIFDSMRKYVEQRDDLTLTIQNLKNQLRDGTVGREAVSSILNLESRLDDFVPTEQTQIDKVFDSDKAKEIVALIEKANGLLG